MNTEDALNKARQLLLSQGMAPIIETALTNSKDVAVGAAAAVGPIIVMMMQETDVPDEELLGSESIDGIAIKLLEEVFAVAADSGIPGADDRAMAEKSVEVLSLMIAKAMSQGRQQPGQPQPPQQPPPQQGGGLLDMQA